MSTDNEGRDGTIFRISSWCSCCSDVVEDTSSSETRPLLPKSGANESSNKKEMLKWCCSVSAGVLGVVCVILGIIVAIKFDPLINNEIDKELQIREGSETYKLWVKPPIVPYLNIYFFNLTNGQEFLHYKEKPIFKEVGPYAYREKWEKINISFHNNGTVSYQTRKTYYFDREASYGPENDIIHTLNVPVTVAAQKVVKMSPVVQLAFNSMLAVLNESAFMYKTVNDLVWGYEDALIKLSKRFLPKDQQFPFDKFGFFYEKNGSTDGIFNVYTGVGNMDKYTTIDMFNFTQELKYWNTPECNRINGTDGTSYPPRIKKSDTLYLFNENLCRSLPLIYNGTVEHAGMTAYRFIPPDDVFADVSQKPENLCYCVGGPPCIGGGVFNISACKFNVSSLLSWPHFYQADAKYLNAVSGLKPDAQKHSLYIDVSPRIGMPLSAQARLQVNFVTVSSPHIIFLANMTSMVFPVIWFEDGVTKLPPKVIALVRQSTVLPQIIKASMLSVFFVVGILFLAFSIFCCNRHRKESTASITKTSSYSATDSGHVNPVMSEENPD